MREKLRKFLKGQAATSIFYILLGLCLVAMPVKMVDVICKVVFGLVLIGAGLYHILIYVKEKINTTLLDMFSGVILLVLGGFLFFNPQIVIKLLPVLLGAFILLDSIWTIRGCLELKQKYRPEWQVFLLLDLIFVVLGIVLMANPFSAVKTTVIFAGWILLTDGILDVAFLIFLKKAPAKSAPYEEKTEVSQKEEVIEEPEVLPPPVEAEQVVEEQAAEEQAAEKQAAEEQAPEEQAAEEQPAEEQVAVEQAVEEQPAEEETAGEEPQQQKEEQPSSWFFSDEEPLEEWKD